MRRRSRHSSTKGAEYEAPATNIQNDVDVSDASREALNQALRALARLLARQAARELFERECVGNPNPEDEQ
jgi:hypothetical protein